MPTVSKVFGLRVVVYPNDHRPAHVHVMGAGCEATFNLLCPLGPPVLRENFGFAPRVLKQLAIALATDLAMLCEKWRPIHGTDD